MSKTKETVEKIFKEMDALFEKVGDVFRLTNYSCEMTNTNGHVEIVGNVRSLKINGYRVKLPNKVLRP